MNAHDAHEWVQDTFDDDTVDPNELDAVFTAVFGRPPDAYDRDIGLWSQVASAVPHCGCSTRREHERGDCA